MVKSTRSVRFRSRDYATASVSGIIIALCILMLMPIHMALSAGIAALSLVIFTVTTLLSLVLIRFSHGRARVIAHAALATSVIGVCVPQFGYLRAADKHDVALSFNPVKYIKFSGETSLEPSSTHTYKTIGGNPLRLAFYASAQTGPQPIVVILHGGGWRYGNYLQTGNWPETLTHAGFSVISLEYRLSSPDRHTWRDTPQDVHDALAYIKTNATTFRLKGDHLHLLGQSAGGHLALLEAYRHHNVRSVISLYAPVDLALDYTTSRDKSAELVLLGGTPDDMPERYRELSPLTYVSPSVPETLIIQGTRDDLVVHENASLLAQRLTDHNAPHTFLLLPLTGHSFENQHGGFATQIAEQTIIQFLRR